LLKIQVQAVGEIVELVIVLVLVSQSVIMEMLIIIVMQYGYGTSSDERIKTNIKTIENALDKTLLLRGVEYNDIRIEPEKRK
jgi:hypothetical protein